MKIVFYSIILNNHQANVADELWEFTGHRYCFVELENPSVENRKGDTRNYQNCPYLLRAWESSDAYEKAMELARTAECCIFSGVQALPFQRARMKLGLLSFDMSERWLKRGVLNVFSPAIFKMLFAYYCGRWNRKPLYKLCCSAFAAKDQKLLGTYWNKCYKWGYFTWVGKNEAETYPDISTLTRFPIMWCSRYLKWKHPELPILLAERLKRKGYRFILDMYGSGGYESKTREFAEKLGVTDVVRFLGNKPNNELMADMRRHSIFLFTSDKNEGWGAVANESMSNGCALVGSDAIGSIPYLVIDGVNGYSFRAPSPTSSFEHPDMASLESLCGRVEWLLQNPDALLRIRQTAVQRMQQIWSPQHAASCLLQLITNLQNSQDSSIINGPCSKA